ncbi:thioesterase-like superfamily-domain-containing protein [Halenospora varia]|nr:thioesterase-like superfamily-domain-containing protein [Halenospora varia]
MKVRLPSRSFVISRQPTSHLRPSHFVRSFSSSPTCRSSSLEIPASIEPAQETKATQITEAIRNTEATQGSEVTANGRQSALHSPTKRSRILRQTKPAIKDSAIIAVEVTTDKRWLSTMKARIGKCIMFGTTQEQTRQIGGVLRTLARDWRRYVVGSEGFPTDSKSVGLLRHKVAWGEMDVMGHVNNVTYVRYAESARVNWANSYATHNDPKHKSEWSQLATSKGVGMILRSIKIDYKFPMTFPDRVSVYHKLASRPRPEDSHFILDVAIVSEKRQRIAARCTEDIVVYDYQQGHKIPIEPFMLEAFKKTWQDQQARQGHVQVRMTELHKQLRAIEKETWDKPGAVEDMGSATKASDSSV